MLPDQLVDRNNAFCVTQKIQSVINQIWTNLVQPPICQQLVKQELRLREA